MKYKETHTLEIAAAKSGMSEITARKYIRQGGKLKKKPRDWKTHDDLFADVWPTLTAMLENDPHLEAKTLLDWLIEQYPNLFNSSHLRTLQRRVREWRVTKGPDKQVIFPQIIQPGRQSQSDFTCCNALEIKIAGEPFPHLLFHFMLPYSRWETVSVAYSESFESLSHGYELAIAELGAVAPDHRTDNLAAAVPIGKAEKKEFQKRWKDFLHHYGVNPSSNNAGIAHENGSVEKSHHLFKKAVDQRLCVRGTRNFATLEAYENFLASIKTRRNKDRRTKLDEELRVMKEPPIRGWHDPKELTVGVSPWSTVIVQRSTYSVPSRLIGTKLKALVFKDVIELWLGNKLLEKMAKVHPGEVSLNYRHVIGHLLRKPGAFRNYRFKECLFPSAVFRRALDLLVGAIGDRGEREYLQILNLAALGSEADVETALQLLDAQGVTPTVENVKDLIECKRPIPEVHVFQPNLTIYDSLFDDSILTVVSQ